MNQVIPAIFAALLLTVGFSFAYAEDDEKLSFAGHIEESLGHFWAIEKNLDDKNAELALVHATHPIAELYDLMKPELMEANPDFDATVQKTLLDLGKKTGKDVTREDAQKAIDDAKSILEEARTLVVGEDLSNDSHFKAKLMIGLLSTSIGEYEEGVKNGQIEMMAEFQDGSAFVWRSQQIFGEIKSDIPKQSADEIDEGYANLWQAYADHKDPSEIATLANGIIHELEEFTGEESSEGGLGVYFDNIERLLGKTNDEYLTGNADEALADATKAYLDNYEFLESPISKQDKNLMQQIEVMMREELRNMIKNGEPSDKISTQIDSILEKLADAKNLVITQNNDEEDEKEADSDAEEYGTMAPLKQVESGIAPKEVQCGDGKELIFKKSTGSPACVKSSTAERLIELGWGTRQ